MTPFTSKIFDQPLVDEPAAHTQEMYAALDTVVQAVLTDQNADIDALLDAANTQVQAAPRRRRAAARPPGHGSGPRRRRGRHLSFAGTTAEPERASDRETWASITEAAPAAERPALDARAARLRGDRARRPERRSLFLLPLLVVFGLFAWFPIIRALVMSVQDTNLVSDPVFVGLDNFAARPRRPAVRDRGPRTRLWFAFLALVFGFPVPIILAVLMSEVRRAARPVQRPRLPARSWSRRSSSVLLWKFFFDGLADGRVQHDPRLVRHRPAAVAPERGAPRCPRSSSRRPGPPPARRSSSISRRCVGVPPELYDAAEVDGASIWQKIRHVTLPQIRTCCS